MNGKKSLHLIYDPLGIEILAIDETFESVFNGLKGVYFRLYYKESTRALPTYSLQKETAYYNRFKEVSKLKMKFKYNDWRLKRQAVQIYGLELRKMVALELSEYVTLKTMQ